MGVGVGSGVGESKGARVRWYDGFGVGVERTGKINGPGKRV